MTQQQPRPTSSVGLGNRRVAGQTDQPFEVRRALFVKAFAARQNHYCEDTLKGRFCGHKI